jgi:Transglutaminase-like superfamily
MDGSLLTRVRFRTALWCQARSMPFLVTPDRSLAWVLAFANRTPRARYAGLPADYILKHVRKVTRRPYLMRERRCLRQGLLAFRFMKAGGYDIELHFGVDRTSRQDMRAHCWIVHDGRVVLNPPDATMETILVHRATAPAAGNAVEMTASAFR